MLKQCKLCNIGFDYDGRNHWSIKYCSKQCRDKVQQIRLNLLSQRYREQNPDKVSKWKHLSYMKKIGTYKERSKINQKNIRKLNKLKVLTFYSKAKFYCDCCKESNLKFLTIDHINGNGNKQRKELFGADGVAGSRFYSWLIKNNYPDGFQVLCMNCNFAKGIYGNCPHVEVI